MILLQIFRMLLCWCPKACPKGTRACPKCTRRRGVQVCEWLKKYIFIVGSFHNEQLKIEKNIYTYIVLLFFKKKIFFNIVESSWGNHIFFFGKKCITLILNDPKLALLIHTSKRVSFLKNQKKKKKFHLIFPEWPTTSF